MVKLAKLTPLAIILFLGIFLTTIAIANNLTQRFNPPPKTPKPTETSKLQTCPDNWYKNEQPCIYKDSPTECENQKKEYFVIDGKRIEVEEVDVEWVKKNCEVKKPEVLN